MTTANLEFACVFVGAGGDRLAGVEQLVLSLPTLVGPDFELDLAYRRPSRSLVAVVRLASGDPVEAEEARDRLRFWAARAGGRASALGTMADSDVRAFHASFAACEPKLRGITAGTLFAAVERFFTSAGAPADRRRNVADRLVLRMEVGGQGWEGVRYDAEDRALFVPAPIAPPCEDRLVLVFRVPGMERPFEVRGTVEEVWSPEEAAPGESAGYRVFLDAPPRALHDALVRHAPWHATEADRFAPRYPIRAPVKVTLPPGPTAANHPRALIEYATEQQLVADWVENLSNRGAFVRTPNPAPAGTSIALELRLPNGLDLQTRGEVVYADARGMEVKFTLTPESQEVLASAIAHIAARARRALVVDDDALVCRMLADALQSRGFEVLTARDGIAGLRALSQEVLALDLLVTDLRMPELDGEALVRTIRTAGGETDLAIVAVTARIDDGLEPRLERLGVDAVLDKSLGPDLIAKAADAVVERKRLVLAAVA